jgi:hypothetical protein
MLATVLKASLQFPLQIFSDEKVIPWLNELKGRADTLAEKYTTKICGEAAALTRDELVSLVVADMDIARCFRGATIREDLEATPHVPKKFGVRNAFKKFK